mmetsp:Transcript_10012/g.25572  ORF Transcript_10012/g.25572 Transcript_10012/m.25572 type:complete len:283 (+) Transcript_10012:159-1007(+)
MERGLRLGRLLQPLCVRGLRHALLGDVPPVLPCGGIIARRGLASLGALRCLPPQATLATLATSMSTQEWERRGTHILPALPVCEGQVQQRRSLTTPPVDPNKTRLPIDTLELADNLEESGFSRDQARKVTNQIADVILRTTFDITQQTTAPADLDKAMLKLEATIAGFKAEVLKTQELHLASLTRDTERLQNDSDKIRAELKYEINKLTASQRLDLNLEKGRIRDELAALREKGNDIEVRIDREINGLKTSLEASKNDIIRYCVATILSVCVMALGVLRLVI